MENRKLVVGVYGGRGYTGRELCRLLLEHPNIGRIIPASKGEESFDEANPNLAGCGLNFVNPQELESRANEFDLVFLRGDGGESLRQAPLFLDKGAKVIDLGADFRLQKSRYERVYGREHTSPQLLEEAVYGLPEFNRDLIKRARLVANPGCYVITGLLGLHPLLKEGIIDLTNIPIFAINGTTGGKSEPTRGLMHSNVSGDILAYSTEGHRHGDEFEERIALVTGEPAMVNFNTAHGDFTTGIHLEATPIVKPEYREGLTRERIIEIYKTHYPKDKFPFVRINSRPRALAGTKESGKDYTIMPRISNVRGTNFCDIGLDYDENRGIIKVVAVADNLVRGSAGTAIQNMNLMFGFDETAGLRGYASL